MMHPGLTKAECEFIIEVADLKNGDRLLDLMCGYGRHSLELARNGIHVTAIDNEPSYINEINVAAQKDLLPVQASATDVLNTSLSGMYQAAICMGNSFAFFNKTDAISLLKKISNVLADDGVLILGSWMIAEIALKHFKPKDWMQVDEYKYLLSYEYQPFPARIESEHTVIRNDGATETIDGVDYIFTLDEMQQMLNEAGLKTKHLFSTPRKKKFSLGDPAIYIVAGKK